MMLTTRISDQADSRISLKMEDNLSGPLYELMAAKFAAISVSSVSNGALLLELTNVLN